MAMGLMAMGVGGGVDRAGEISKQFNLSTNKSEIKLEIFNYHPESKDSAAGRVYETLLRQNRKDKMLRMMYAAFWMRYGLEPKAAMQ